MARGEVTVTWKSNERVCNCKCVFWNVCMCVLHHLETCDIGYQQQSASKGLVRALTPNTSPNTHLECREMNRGLELKEGGDVAECMFLFKSSFGHGACD